MDRFGTILDRLLAAYGSRARRPLPALDELILTVLSQNTSDLNCERAYGAMRERYPRWEADVLAFTGAGLRRGPVKFFPETGESAARAWLAE